MLEAYTKNVSDVFSAVKRQFGDESGVQITDSDISRWVDDAQMEIIVNNSEVNASFAKINVVAQQTAYPVKDNIQDVYVIQSIHYDGEYLKGYTFQEAQLHIIQKDIEIDNSGRPVLWYERGGVIHFYPKPSEDLVEGISIFYSAKPTAITNNASPLTVPDHYFSLVVQYCLTQAHMMDENSAMAQVTAQNFDTGVAQRANRNQSENNTYPVINNVDGDW